MILSQIVPSHSRNLSVSLTMFIAYLITVFILNVCRKVVPYKAEKWFRRLQLVSSALFSLGHGGNDAQKVMGIIGAAVIFFEVQNGNTSLMMFSPEKIIAFVSQYFTLRVGDLIFTGTPKGVGKVAENDILEAYLEEKKVLDLRIQ